MKININKYILMTFIQPEVLHQNSLHMFMLLLIFSTHFVFPELSTFIKESEPLAQHPALYTTL